jgi:SAM-dependent methyltransferase
MKREFQIGFLRDRGLEPQHRLIDVGCGTLRGGITLIEYLEAGHYTGLDVRQEALDEGREELAAAGLEDKQPRLVCSDDLASLDLGTASDFAWAFAVLIHMPDEVAASCISMAARNLRPGGRFFATVNIGDQSEGQWREFPVVHRSLEFYSGLAERSGFSLEVLGNLASLGHRGGLSGDHSIMLELTRLG